MRCSIILNNILHPTNLPAGKTRCTSVKEFSSNGSGGLKRIQIYMFEDANPTRSIANPATKENKETSKDEYKMQIVPCCKLIRT